MVGSQGGKLKLSFIYIYIYIYIRWVHVTHGVTSQEILFF